MRYTSPSRALLVLGLVTLACGPSGEEGAGTTAPEGTSTPDGATPTAVPATATPIPATPTPEPTGNGILALKFAIDPDYMEYMQSLGYDPVGTFYGAIYDADDVSGSGPDDDAVILEGVEVAVDMMPEGGPTEVLYTTGSLPAGKVAVLGFINVNGDDNLTYPTHGDAATLPGDNKFSVVADQTSEAVVFFGIVL